MTNFWNVSSPKSYSLFVVPCSYLLTHSYVHGRYRPLVDRFLFLQTLYLGTNVLLLETDLYYGFSVNTQLVGVRQNKNKTKNPKGKRCVRDYLDLFD